MKSNHSANPASAPRRIFFYGYIIIAAVFIIQIISFSINDSFGVFVEPWVNYFSWSRAAISGAYSVSFLIMGGMGILMGILTDKYRPRVALSLCAVCLVTGFIFDRTGSYSPAFILCGLVGILGLVLTSVLRPTRRLQIEI